MGLPRSPAKALKGHCIARLKTVWSHLNCGCSLIMKGGNVVTFTRGPEAQERF